MSFEAAVAVAYLFGMVTAYVLAKIFVFDKSGLAVATEFRRFVIVNLLSLAIVWVVSVGLALTVFPAVGLRWHAEDVAHLIGVLSPSVVAYSPTSITRSAATNSPRTNRPLRRNSAPRADWGADTVAHLGRRPSIRISI